MTVETKVFCRTALASEQRDAVFVEIDGSPRRLTLRLSQLSKQIAQSADPILTDLLEVAGYVYAADTVVSRGGQTQRRMGEDWRRNLHLSVPVRELETWKREEVSSALEEVLSFVSEDRWSFTFRQAELAPDPKVYLDLVETEETAPTSVMLFSGGLDSFAGALDEIVSSGERVALVTHGFGTKLAPIQRELVAYLREQTNVPSVQHIPVTAQVRAGETKEETHRSRSFLFAALGVATARCFGLDRIHFFENGVVSMNLPLGRHVVGARATRSTHPRTLAGFGKFFSTLLDTPTIVDNPFFWKTKAEVVSPAWGSEQDPGDLQLRARPRDYTAAHPLRTVFPMRRSAPFIAGGRIGRRGPGCGLQDRLPGRSDDGHDRSGIGALICSCGSAVS